ncbi:unnamed protein product [Mytilus coruscus]|uniref:Uncharacterized protein n=1 Tax=Mytilus coruscus TaxID=42192 RepID=A0A6J8BHF4_MYTCO|nr:unnamed protein product [Mytilus coruscus]
MIKCINDGNDTPEIVIETAKTPIQPQIQANEATQENPNPTLPSSTRTRNPSGKHKVGINNNWLKQYSWLYFDKDFSEDGTLVDVMLCKLCNKHQSHGSNGSQTWSTVGYKLLRKDKIQIHQDSEQHKYAITLDMAHTVDDMASNISTGAQKAVKDALKVLFFILRHHLPLDLFGSTVDLCIDVGATDLSKLCLAKNATYSSWDTVHELLEILSSKVHQLLLDDVKASPCYATMVDEVTDNRTIKHLAICTRYISKDGEVQNGFLTDIELPNTIIQPLSTAEVERIFSQVKLIKTSHRANLKTQTLTKILTVKLNCDETKFEKILDQCVTTFFKKKNRRLVNVV